MDVLTQRVLRGEDIMKTTKKPRKKVTHKNNITFGNDEYQKSTEYREFASSLRSTDRCQSYSPKSPSQVSNTCPTFPPSTASSFPCRQHMSPPPVSPLQVRSTCLQPRLPHSDQDKFTPVLSLYLFRPVKLTHPQNLNNLIYISVVPYSRRNIQAFNST